MILTRDRKPVTNDTGLLYYERNDSFFFEEPSESDNDRNEKMASNTPAVLYVMYQLLYSFYVFSFLF